ncbi:MAG: sigma-70 family RNA polymerase sigma factor [Acidobacteriota bacterium]
MPEAFPVAPQFADERIFVNQLQSGDSVAFEALVRRHTQTLLQVARRLMRSEEDARDALQDTYVAVLRSIDRFEGASHLSTWLHRVLINACLMKLRSRRRHPEEPLDDLLATLRHRESIEATIQSKEIRALIHASIKRLPETYRQVIQLRDIEELSTEQTAEMLGVTPNAVKIRVHRARRALRSIIAERGKNGS